MYEIIMFVKDYYLSLLGEEIKLITDPMLNRDTALKRLT